MGARLNRGGSRQDYGTPPEFLLAVQRLLHIPYFGWDLAASKENAKAARFFTEADDSLKQAWHALYYNAAMPEWLWLNPPFSNIEPWAAKACDEARMGAFVAMLVPASVGANWWRDYVDGWAFVHFLNGRLTFEGETTPYPKDCALLTYQPSRISGYRIFNWRAIAKGI